MLIGVLGDLEDLAAVYVGWLAQQRGLEVWKLAEGTLGVDWEYQSDPELNRGGLRREEREVAAQELSGVFVRLNPDPPLPAGLSLELEHRIGFVQERREGIYQWLETLACPIINRPSAGRSNASKPYQMARLDAEGFTIPRWIVSNDLDAVRAFVASCPDGAIYKATSGLRSHVRRVDDALLERLERGTTPTVVQEYIRGTDVRVHTVNSKGFGCEVVSNGVDYRFEEEGVRYRGIEVPSSVKQRCCDVAKREGLVLSGFDFRVTSDAQWYCLEVNPVPSFLPYEFSSGLPIGNAIVDALLGTGLS